ncbi:MAG: hypothetical protein AB1411_06320 [Nitrospirota bacterium]
MGRPVGPALIFLSLFAVSCHLIPPHLKPLPSADEQRAMVQRNDLRLHRLSSRAFLEAWGPPTYEYRATTQFFAVEDGNYIPRFLVPTGEAPPNSEDVAMAGDGYFLAYEQRGEVVGFLDDRLVYRSRMSAEKIRALGKQWQRESQFHTDVERSLTPR